MARPRTFSVAAGSNVVFPVNWRAENFLVSISVVAPAGCAGSVEHTLDDIYSDATPTWIAHTSLGTVTAGTTEDGNYSWPFRALRLTAGAGTGNVEFSVIQAE